MTDCDILTASEIYEDADMKERRYADTRTYSERTLLDRSRLTPSDEYYTRRSDVVALVDAFHDLLDWRPVFCPFDTEDSSFVCVLRERGYDVHASADDYRYHLDEIAATPRAIVFSNPPFSIARQIMKDFTEHGIDFLLLGHTMRAAAYTKRGYFCRRLWTMTFDTTAGAAREIPCLMVSNLNIRQYEPKRPGDEVPQIEGKPFYKTVQEWVLAGQPSDCYCCSLWVAYPHADFFDFEIPSKKYPGYYSPIHIIAPKIPSRKLEGSEEGTADREQADSAGTV